MRTEMRTLRLSTAIFCLAGVVVGISGGAASAASKPPIVIGLITDETGVGAPTYGGSEVGAEARIDAQNAAGGVDGRKIQLVVEDDQSTPSGNLSAAQTLVEDKGVFAIIDNASIAFGGVTYLNKQKIPITGAAEDGTEWGEQPNTNMFSVSGTLTTPINGRTYGYNDAEAALKAIGVTKLATVTANVPSAINAANGIFAAAKPLGISECLNDIVPIGDVNFTTFALEMKSKGCNGVEVLSLLSSCTALATAIKQAGLKAKEECATGYDQSVLTQPSALAAMQGTYTSATINVLGNDIAPPVKKFLGNLKKYTAWPGGIPSLNIDFEYEAADLMIKGLQLAGPNPTRSAVIADLRKVNGYTAGGLIPSPGDNFTHFGTLAGIPKSQCLTLLEIKGKSYVPAGKPACGTLVSSKT
jgi:branched-chain amino acid transport system substrate-binding protein